jgi:hypothetical protein
MKMFCLKMVLACLGLAVFAPSASALPPFNKEWMGKYVEGNPNAEFVKAVGIKTSCEVCHLGKNRKDKNEYGKAVGKYLTKKDYNALKDNADQARKYVLGGLE